MATWPWEKRLFYLDGLNAVNEYEQEQLPEIGETTEPGSIPNASNIGTGTTPTVPNTTNVGGAKHAGTTKDVPPSVANHEHVIKNQSDYD